LRLRPGATVVLHDINLPLVEPEFQDWGAKYLFDGLDTTKDVPDDGELANIGRFAIPEDKAPPAGADPGRPRQTPMGGGPKGHLST
jgi:hypothetical protein